MQRLPDPNLPWPICMEAVALIAEAEGCRLRAYLCPAGVPTIGWGETDGVRMGMVWTQQEADRRFCESLASYTADVRRLLTGWTTDEQLGAMVSLAYNIGPGAFGKSTVLRQHNAGDADAAARAFGLWNKARVNGVLTELKGLTARRAAESALYLRPPAEEPHERMPQAVQPESSLAASPIARTGAAVGASGALVALDGIGAHLDTARGLAGKLGDLASLVGVPPQAFLAAALVAAGGALVWWRWKQRRGGWA